MGSSASTMHATLRTLMLLTPFLATQTVACPHMILPIAIAGAVKITGSLKIREPQPPPSTVRLAPQTPTPSRQTAGLLVRKDDAWRSVSALTPNFIDSEISDATLSQTPVSNHKGTECTEWKITSPITFEYRVREEADVLDPASDALIYGHLAGDPVLLAKAKARPLKRVVVVDDTVHALYGERIEAYFAHYGVQTRLLVLPTTEENKNMDMVLTIAEAIHDLGIDRRLDPVIAIGGGVCMEIVGFAASIYRRRTPYIRVPTTLMGYVDASIGAKSDVNFSGKKNKLGAYLPPALAILDRSFLATLDQRQLSNGAAAIAKMALVKDPALFHLLCEHGEQLIDHKFQDYGEASSITRAPSRVLFLAIQTMLEELAPNLWEDSLERLVDFGHVFSMELEMDQLHHDKLFHGEAVAIDMAFSTVLAFVRGHISESERDHILGAMKGLRLPVFHPRFNEALCEEALHERIKFSSGQKIPLPTALGQSRLFNDISLAEMREALVLWPELV